MPHVRIIDLRRLLPKYIGFALLPNSNLLEDIWRLPLAHLVCHSKMWQYLQINHFVDGMFHMLLEIRTVLIDEFILTNKCYIPFLNECVPISMVTRPMVINSAALLSQIECSHLENRLSAPVLLPKRSLDVVLSRIPMQNTHTASAKKGQINGLPGLAYTCLGVPWPRLPSWSFFIVGNTNVMASPAIPI